MVTAVIVEQWMYYWMQMFMFQSSLQLYDEFSSCFAAGALASAEPGQARTIYQAVVDKKWATARKLLDAVMEGR